MNKPTNLKEGPVFKGGLNLPNTSTDRPDPPGGSGGITIKKLRKVDNSEEIDRLIGELQHACDIVSRFYRGEIYATEKHVIISESSALRVLEILKSNNMKSTYIEESVCDLEMY